MTNKILYDLNKISLADKQKIGGKALGLLESYDYIADLQELGIDVCVPKTFVLSNECHQEYLREKQVPNTVLVQAVKAMHASGGNVAVRSSADIEDGANKSYSGAFESVLNVSTVDEMRAALQTVYQSAQNVTLDNNKTPKMSVIIQQMIDKPDNSGVAYSEDFDGDPFVVINRVKGKTAEKLVTGQEQGEVIKISKYIRKDGFAEKGIGVLSPEAYANFNTSYHLLSIRTDYKGEQIQPWAYKCAIDNRYGKEVLPLIAIINHMEEKQGHPIDMEFAVKNGKIYVLQQRPYLMAQNFIIKTLPNQDIVGYFKDSPIIISEMTDHNSPIFKESYRKDQKIFDLSGYIFSSYPIHYRNNKEFSDASHFAYYGKLKADLIVDNYGYMRNVLYGHQGNEFREMGQPFWISAKGDALQSIKAGEKIRIDLSKGTFNRVLSNLHTKNYFDR
ncbi:MAG: hypothetical protein J6Y53_03570 [Alphaproteobacteria bacterium]|nr:hypothetical protein [Alphaproteobacteria bacterium]